MYTPTHFRMEDESEMRAVMRSYDFGLLLIPGEPDLAATHIPFKLADERLVLIGHVAMANPASAAIKAGKEAMVVFTGPHAYVSLLVCQAERECADLELCRCACLW